MVFALSDSLQVQKSTKKLYLLDTYMAFVYWKCLVDDNKFYKLSLNLLLDKCCTKCNHFELKNIKR